jgi:hypothetical protein
MVSTTTTRKLPTAPRTRVPAPSNPSVRVAPLPVTASGEAPLQLEALVELA